MGSQKYNKFWRSIKKKDKDDDEDEEEEPLL